jgi:ADP-ribose pyrophosphatase YjhB (NUDIX family)
MKPAVSRRIYSLIFIRDTANNKVLLGYKKRGFGVNKWTGLGGKVEPNESLYECAKREAKEECGLDIDNVNHLGCIEFQFEDKMNELLEVHVFCSDSFRGELQECDGNCYKLILQILKSFFLFNVSF